MADVRFKIKRIKRGYGDKAFWKGVVSMIAPKKLKGNPAKATGHVLWQWRNRLLALKKAGYASVVEGKQFHQQTCTRWALFSNG